MTPELTACKLSIQLQATGTGSEATITYCLTSLGPQGDVVVAAFTEEFYAGFMRQWEMRLNHYLRTGQKLAA